MYRLHSMRLCQGSKPNMEANRYQKLVLKKEGRKYSSILLPSKYFSEIKIRPMS